MSSNSSCSRYRPCRASSGCCPANAVSCPRSGVVAPAIRGLGSCSSGGVTPSPAARASALYGCISAPAARACARAEYIRAAREPAGAREIRQREPASRALSPANSAMIPPYKPGGYFSASRGKVPRRNASPSTSSLASSTPVWWRPLVGPRPNYVGPSRPGRARGELTSRRTAGVSLQLATFAFCLTPNVVQYARPPGYILSGPDLCSPPGGGKIAVGKACPGRPLEPQRTAARRAASPRYERLFMHADRGAANAWRLAVLVERLDVGARAIAAGDCACSLTVV